MLVVVLVAVLVTARSSTDAAEGSLIRTKARVAGGAHWRLGTPRGPIHIWIPAGYERATAGLVVYVHGWYMTADRAWRTHGLAAQFRASRRNAMFLVPEAPRSAGEPVRWTSLAALIGAIRRAGLRVPAGPVVAAAHSAGYRTIARWGDDERIEQVILLDALYGGERSFEAYLRARRSHWRPRMILVASDTKKRAAAFAARFDDVAMLERIPDVHRRFSPGELAAKLMYMRSQYGHAAIMDGGVVLPLTLHLAPLPQLDSRQTCCALSSPGGTVDMGKRRLPECCYIIE